MWHPLRGVLELFSQHRLLAVQTDQVQVPSAPTAQMTAREPERQVAQRCAHRTWSATVRKTHLLLSRRGSSMFEPMTWHGRWLLTRRRTRLISKASRGIPAVCADQIAGGSAR